MSCGPREAKVSIRSSVLIICCESLQDYREPVRIKKGRNRPESGVLVDPDEMVWDIGKEEGSE